MNKPRLPRMRWIQFASLSLFLVLLNGRVTGQTSSAAPAMTSSSDQEVVNLSPFQVNVSRDVGFIGASSLAGGRLAGDLKDTPVAYSVLTKDFLDALNLTDLTDAATWLVNTNSTSQNGITDLYTVAEINFRGVAGPSLYRNYFKLGVNYDTYNVDRVDQARGPNAIVFGNGNIAGVATVLTKVAQPGVNSQELKVGYGSYGTVRLSADINASLNDKLALRANLLYQDGSTFRGPQAFEFRRAATLAGTWNFTPTFQLRVEAEVGRIERNTTMYGFWDHFSGWNGTTVFTGATASPPSNSNLVGVQRWANPTFFYVPALSDGVINLGNSYTTQGGNQASNTPMGGVTVVGTGLQASGYVTLPVDAAVDLPANRFDLAAAGSRFRIPQAGWTAGINGPTWFEPFNDYTINLDKRIGNLSLSLSGFYGNETRNNIYVAGNAFQNVYIDLNQTLPSGANNPEYLEPYDMQVYTGYNMATQNRSIRMAAAYLLKGTRWGNYSFDVQAGVDQSRTINEYTYDVVELNSDAALWPSANQVEYRYYWDEVNRPVKTAGTVTYNGVTYPVALVPGTQSASNLTDQTVLSPYIFAAAKAQWFHGRMDVLAAVRHDSYSSKILESVPQGDYPTNWNGTSIIWAPPAPSDWATLTYIPKDANGNPLPGAVPLPADTRPRNSSTLQGLPQYANDRFRDDYSPPNIKVSKTTYSAGSVFYLMPDWLSVFYNYATSFNPNSAYLTITGQPFAPQTSFGDDLGLRVNFGTRWSASVETYHGVNRNESWDPGTGLDNALNAIINANVVGDLSTGGMNQRGLNDVPNHFFEARNHVSNGYEFELLGNPWPGWRVMVNGAITRAYQTNAYKNFLTWWAQNGATMKLICQDAGVTFDPTTNVASTTQTSLTSPDAAAAVSAWNTIQTTYIANAVAGSQPVTRDVKNSANVYVDYEFQTGRLRGFRIGGGANYRGPEVIGYRGADTIVNPANTAQAIDDPTVNAYNPVWGHPYTVATMMMSYHFKANHGKDDVVVALNVGNVFNYEHAIYYDTVMRPPNANLSDPARIAVPGDFYFNEPRNYTLTVTFKL